MARKNKPQHKQPAPARSWPRARRMAAVAGLAAGAALLAGTAAVPATATATTAPPMPRVSAHEMTGTGRASTAAERAVTYWTRARMLSARNGDRIQLTSPRDSHAMLRHPTGPTGR